MRIQIHRRVAFAIIVLLALVSASFAGGDAPPLHSGPVDVASTMAAPAKHPSVPEKSTGPEDITRQKTLALLILMLKEGRGAR